MALKLSFRDNSEHESGFHVYRSDAPMDPRNLPKPYKDLGRNSSVVIDEDFGGIFDQRRYYRVAAYVKGGNRSVSEEVYAGYDGKSPTLKLDFASLQYAVAQGIGLDLSPRAFSDLITFTRSTGGGRFNAQGQYEWLPANTPRIDYAPGTGECLGLLIEEQRTNLLTYSSDFANAAWIKLAVSLESADDGAYKVTTTSANSYHQIGQALSASAGTYSLSVDVKTIDCPYLAIFPINTGGAFADSLIRHALINLTTMTASGASGTGIAVVINPVDNGFHRISVTVTSAYNSAAGFAIRLQENTNPSAPHIGTGKSLLLRRPQLEAGAFPASHIPAQDAQVTRAADIASVNELSPWFNAAAGTFVIEHDALDGAPLLSSGANTLAVSQEPGTLTVAYDQSGSYVSHNGGAYVPGPALVFDGPLRLMATESTYANAHLKQLRYYPRKVAA